VTEQQQALASSVDYVTAYAEAAGEVVSAIGASDMGARVPGCPGWSTYDLVVHLGNVHAWAATILETGAEAPRQTDEPPSKRARAVAQWYSGKAEDLLTVLRESRAADSCWTFSRDHRTTGFWQRRQAHETAVHLADLRASSSRRPSRLHAGFTPALAADGALEVLEVFLPRMHDRGKPAELRAPLLVHARDTRDTWLLTPVVEGPPKVSVVHPDDDVDDTADLVAAPAAELMLLLWQRLPVDHEAVTVDGHRERILAFLQGPLTA
jgi:uncharacterized protein (TIGR03083 family)